jgi:selenocysteine lyase/cysteine desulfurase
MEMSRSSFWDHVPAVEPAEFRQRFPILREKTYLASCSQGALSPQVRAAVGAFLDSWDQEGNPWDAWVEESERLRAEFATLIGADPGEIAITFSASSALNAVVGALDLRRRSRLLATDHDFPTVGQILLAQVQRGAAVDFVPERDGGIDAADVADSLDDRTALVAATHVAYRSGARLDVAAAARAAHDAGALFALDAYQSLGVQPVDVRAMDVDILIGGALKYLLGPAGVAFLYVRRELIETLSPLESGWFAQENPFAFDTWHLQYAPNANRFQSGSPPIPSVFGARAGLTLVQEVGVDATAAHVERLASRLIEGAVAAGYQVRTPPNTAARGPLVVLGTTDAERLAALLRDAGIVCAPRSGGLRCGFHFYNLEEDVDRLLDELARHRDLLEVPLPA